MNAGGAPNTCKSNGTYLRIEASGERLSNKSGVPHGTPAKAPTGGDGSAAHQVDGGVTAHRADNG